MLLQRLAEYSARLEHAAPYGFAPVSVRYEIHLDGEGRLLTPEPIDLATKENKFGQRRLAPQVRRAGTRPPPLLLADHAEYTFGLPRKPEDADKARLRHADYLALLSDCAAATGNTSAAAVLTFLNGDPLSALHLDDAFDRGGAIEFRVDGRLVTQDQDVRRFWAARNRPADDGSGDMMQCIVCNEFKPVLERLPDVIKGIPKGSTMGTAIISANSTAFESYGLDASKIAPICADCAKSFSNGINDLLRERSTSLRVENTAHIFWTKEDVGFQIAGWFDDPDSEQVRELIRSVRSASYDPHLDPMPFYMAALTASNARAVVRDWLDTSLGNVKQSLALWFERQAIVQQYGEEPKPLKLYALAAATVRDPKKEMQSQTVTALLRSAFTGVPIPDRLLQQAVRRCQAEQSVTRPRAALLKLVLLSHQKDFKENEMVYLQTDHPDPAYHCGRLLAVLEAVQRVSADTKLNTTLIDRFYGTASSAPASVFGTLVRGAQPHLAKMRKTRKGAAIRLQDELEQVIAALPAFPQILTAKEQAVFALGYYHQRAHQSAQARLRAAMKNQAADDTSDDATDSSETE